MSQLKAQLRRDGFTFKQFFVAHDRCAMKVGTDGILLGAWAPVAGVKRILDIGTGSGLVALMLAQRTEEHVTIDAVELDAQAAEQASENAAESPWQTGFAFNVRMCWSGRLNKLRVTILSSATLLTTRPVSSVVPLNVNRRVIPVHSII